MSRKHSVVLSYTMAAIVAGAGILMSTAQTTTVTVDDRQSGKTVEISLDQTLAIRLPAQLGTGYSWSVARSDAPVRLLNSSIESNRGGAPGSSETQIFLFQPTAPGSGDIELAYHQPWLREQPPGRTFKSHVIVRDAPGR